MYGVVESRPSPRLKTAFGNVSKSETTFVLCDTLHPPMHGLIFIGLFGKEPVVYLLFQVESCQSCSREEAVSGDEFQ